MVLRSFLFLVCCALLQGCSVTPLHNIPLMWKPTNDIYHGGGSAVTNFPDQAFKVMPFADMRVEKAEIARNVESSAPKLVTTKDDVAAWCTDRFKEIIGQLGYNLVENNPTVVLKGEIYQFYVLEDSLYKGTVGIKLTAETPSGEKLWQGMLTGTAKRFGHSYDQNNYYETLSDAYLEAVQSLMSSDDFKKALQRKS